MKIQATNNYNYSSTKTNFKAQFFHSESLKEIVEYSVNHGKFEKLNNSRKNISKSMLTTRLMVDAGKNEKGNPFLKITRYIPKDNIVKPQCMEDYKISKVSTFESGKNMNYLKFAFEKLLSMGNNVPQNKIFRKVVIEK